MTPPSLRPVSKLRSLRERKTIRLILSQYYHLIVNAPLEALSTSDVQQQACPLLTILPLEVLDQVGLVDLLKLPQKTDNNISGKDN